MPCAVCDAFGPRYGHGVVQLTTCTATFAMALVNNVAGFIACRMLIGEWACRRNVSYLHARQLAALCRGLAGGDSAGCSATQ
jgi:hypothetical protein